MTLDDLKRLFTRQTLFRLDAILSPRLDELNIAPRRVGQAAVRFAWASRFSHGCEVMAK